MPSGKIHLAIWRRNRPLAVAISLTSMIMWWSLNPLAFILGYGIGLFIDPDLDQDMVTACEWRMMQYFGDVGAFLVGYFMWYGYRFTHRKPKKTYTAHSPLFGTLSRWVYVFLFPMIFWVWYRDWSQFELFYQPWFVWMFAGNWFSDLLHIALDYGYLPKVMKGR